ncbi:unnamed protein product, partial [Owenia fusiformis]
STAMVLVEELPVELLTPLEDVSVIEKETINLECEISKPNIKANWFKNGKEIKPSKQVVPKVEGTKHFLTIKESEMDDAGNYSIKLEDVSSKCKVTVKGNPNKFFLINT